MTISSLSSLSGAYSQQSAASHPPQSQPPASTNTQDTVQLSPQAQAALAKDADHDGDSH